MTTITIDWYLVAKIGAAITCSIFAYIHGYATGVKHTEQRWKDAVGRCKE